MPSHRPLRGEIWVKRVYSNANQKPDSEEATKHSFMLATQDAQFVDHRAASIGEVNGWKRVKVTNVSGKSIEYIYPVGSIGDATSGHIVNLDSFLADWTYQNPYMYPQVGSLWIRNNTPIPDNKSSAELVLGDGNMHQDRPVILYIVRGVNTTRHDCDKGMWLRDRPGYDECTVRIYNTNDVNEAQRRGISNVDWSGGVQIDSIPFIQNGYISWSTQGGNSSEGRPLGWRVRRNTLKTYYTYVGIAPEYLDNIDIPLDITHRMVPKVGQIFKVKTGDDTHGQMVTSVSWSRDYRDMHAYACYDSSALYQPGVKKRGPCTRFLPLFGTFPVLPDEVHNAPQNERDYEQKYHYPNDNPTLIVTTVQVFDRNRNTAKWLGNDFVWWGDRAYMWEIGEFNQLFRIAKLKYNGKDYGDFGAVSEGVFQKNHIIRYRQMIKSCNEPQPNESRQPSNFTGLKGGQFPPNNLNETKQWFKNRPRWWPKGTFWGHYQWEMPRLGQMLKAWNGQMVRVIYISRNHKQIITFGSNGQEMTYANDLARTFWNYHQELTSLKLDFISLDDKKKKEDLEEFKKSLVYNDWEIRKLKSTSYVMALPNNIDKSTNTMLTVHGPLILINEFRNYLFYGPSKNGNYKNASTTTATYRPKREKEDYEAVIAQMFGSTNEDTRPFCGGKLQIVRRTIRRAPVSFTPVSIILPNFNTPWHDFKPHILSHVQTHVHLLTVGSVWKWRRNMDKDYRFANTIQGGFPSQHQIIVLGPALDPVGGMRELEKDKEHCLWVKNTHRDDDCGVYTMPVGYLIDSYNFEGHASKGFSMHSISRKTVLNLALLHDLSDTAENGAQFRNGEVSYEKFTIMLPPNAVENYFPKTGEVWHHKIVPQLKRGPPPKGSTQELAWTKNFIRADVTLDTSALNYVQWPLLNGTFRARPSEYYYMHNSSEVWWKRGDLYQYLGDYSQRISDTMTFDQKFQLLMRAKKYRVEVGQVFLNWRAGRLYYVSRTIKNKGKVGGYEFKVLHERTQRQRPDDDAPLFTSIQLAHATDSTQWESLCFLGWRNWDNWRHVDKPISGSIYKLDPIDKQTRGYWHYDYNQYKGLYPRERRPREDPMRNFWKKYTWLQKKTGITLKWETEVEVLGTGPNDRNDGPPTVEFRFVIKNIPDDNIYNESVTLTEEDFHMLFIYRAPQAYTPFEAPEYQHHITYKEEKIAAQAQRRNREVNRQRNEEEATSVTEWTCMICQESSKNPETGEDDPMGIVTSANYTTGAEVKGYIFTHNSEGRYAKPHLICGGCAANVIRYDREQQDNGNRQLKNADDTLIFNQYMGAMDANRCATGPFTIECPQCRVRHPFRRLYPFYLGKSTRQGDRKVIYKELDNLKLKF